jgi:hypothetical protein
METEERRTLEPKEFQVEEFERRNRPLESVATDAERYIISLPDRTNMLEGEGYDRFDIRHRDSLRDFGVGLDDAIQIIFSSDNADVLEKRVSMYSSETINGLREQIKTFRALPS